jgi:hypothetical protein
MSDAITIDVSSLDRAVKKLILPEEMIRRIMALTITRTARWASTRMRSNFKKLLKVDGKVIKGRMRLTIKTEEGAAQIWMGLNPIGAEKFNPVQNLSGVTTSVKEIPSAFIKVMKNGKELVLTRQGKERYPTRKEIYSPEGEGMAAFDIAVKDTEKALARNFEKSYMDVISK